MNVTLNSLTSPGMVAATLAGAARGGRVVEISKRDIWSPERVAQERPDVAYRLVAIDFLPGAVRASACGALCVLDCGSIDCSITDCTAIDCSAFQQFIHGSEAMQSLPRTRRLCQNFEVDCIVLLPLRTLLAADCRQLCGDKSLAAQGLATQFEST